MGTLAGLAGVTMIELHCANFQALHVMLWHTAVILLSAVTGALLAWLLRFSGRLRPSQWNPIDVAVHRPALLYGDGAGRASTNEAIYHLQTWHAGQIF